MEKIATGRIPRQLVNGWNGVVYYFQTTMEKPHIEKHKELVKQGIKKIINESFDSWPELRPERIAVVLWEPKNQVTLVKFCLHDSL